jgi:hypothetical protein
MSNPTETYNNTIRASLTGGLTYSNNRYRFNNLPFITYKRASWYKGYLTKFGYSEEPSVTSGIAWIGGEGQSNMGTLGNTVDQLSSADVGLFPDQFIFDNTTNTTTPNIPLVPYILARTGETFDGVVGPSGQRNIGQSDGQPVGPLVGLNIDYRSTDWLDGSGTGLWTFLYSSAGKKASHFQPFGETASYDVGDQDANKGYQFRCYGYKAARAELISLGEPVYRQAMVWAQGEANTNPARDSANTSHISITSYPAEWQKIYDFRVKQEGPQPPWFIVQLLPVWNTAESSRDVYTDAMNVQLKSLARYTVNMVGGSFNSIVDNGSGNPNVYYLQHDYTTKLGIFSEDPHFTAVQQKEMGQAIASALKVIHGGNGWTSAYPLSEIKPAISGYTVSGGASSVTVSGYVTDPCTVYTVTTPTGAPTPTVSQIIAGSGGAINGSGSFVVSQTTAGAGFSFSVPSVPSGEVATYTVCRITSGETSVLESDTATVTEAVLSWDETYRTDVIAYSDSNLTATHTAASGAYYVRGKPVSSSGKKYFEALVGGTLPPPVFVGIGDFDISVGGGASGVNRAGWLASNIQYSSGAGGANQSAGGALVFGDRVQVAFDLDTRLMWIRRNGTGNWNNIVGADPTTGVGGLSIHNLDTMVIPVVGLGVQDSVTLSLTTEQWVLTPPSGFGPIG